ncbi:hypothetical protein ACFFGT_29580 [Mucilaginibacter angelicae]|uniref:DUF4412 domain-containing protein n=1 Tax=Mucilaginibacter angelicae TaxID=869718 RepID=A0ABV6LFZ6_9SPHI
MKKILTLVLITLYTSIASGQSYKPEYGTPLVVLTETNPWLMVIGSDVPTFVLYKKGQILYKKKVSNKIKYFQVKLDQDEVGAALKKLGITDSLQKLPAEINASSASDQPTSELILNLNSTKQISVYGSLRYEKSKARENTPAPFLKVYDNLINFKDDKAKEWVPDIIEVMFTTYSNSPEKPLKWPTEWPDLKNPHSVQRSVDLYSIYLDKNDINKLKKLVNSLKDNQAVEVNGRKFSISYRFPFPNIR